MTETAKNILNREVLAHGIDFNKIKTHGLYITESRNTSILTKRYEELLNYEQALDVAVEALKEVSYRGHDFYDTEHFSTLADKALAEIEKLKK